jgi:hypothetical protein
MRRSTVSSRTGSSTWSKFEGMPMTGVTPAIGAQEDAQIATINSFFGLHPALTAIGGECTAVGPGKKPAASAWATEPVQSLTGVSVAPLKRAVLDLRHGRTTDKGDLSCYPAAIVDLQNLESTTRQEMARNVLVGYEIGHLNQFFENRQYVLGGPDNPVVPK